MQKYPSCDLSMKKWSRCTETHNKMIPIQDGAALAACWTASILRGYCGSHSRVPWWRSSQRSKCERWKQFNSKGVFQYLQCYHSWWKQRFRQMHFQSNTHHDDSNDQGGQTDDVELLREELDQFIMTTLTGRKRENKECWPRHSNEWECPSLCTHTVTAH